MGTNKKWRRVRNLQILSVVAAIGLIIWGLWTYVQQSSQPQTVQIVFQNAQGAASVPFSLEIAHTPGERARGLSFRKPGELTPEQGMIFVFPDEAIRSFWMKDTYIPLDMLFLDRKLRVVGLLADVPVLNEKPRRVELPSKYVIELPAGSAAQHGIVIGSTAKPLSNLPGPS